MSVINKMLKDLEQRRAGGFDGDEGMLDDLDAGAAAAPIRKKTNSWLAFWIFFVIAIFSTWLYLEGYFEEDKKQVTPPPVAVVKPEVIARKSVVQEIIIKPDELIEKQATLAKTEYIGETEKNLAVVSAKIQATDTAVQSDVMSASIKIESIVPSPLRATGKREVITVRGSGFVAPLSIIVEWDAGRAFKELEPWQVKIISETEIRLHLNLGNAEDDWRLIIKQVDGRQQAEYKFIVVAKLKDVAVPQEKILPLKSESSFTKTNRTLSLSEQVKVEYSKASLLMQQGKVSQAKDALHDVLALDFSHLQARQALAAILFREQAYDEAIEVLELGNIQHPEHVPFILLLARIYTERGQDPLAVELLQRQQPAVASNSEYYALLAALYQRSAQHKKSADVYKSLLLSFPSKAVWWMGLGLSLQSLNNNQDALFAYNKSLQTQGLTTELQRFVKTRIAQLNG